MLIVMVTKSHMKSTRIFSFLDMFLVSSDCCVVEIDWWLLGDKKSSVVAHISEVGVFTGMVATSDEVYHIEVCVDGCMCACV